MAAVAATLLLAPAAHAASATWNGSTDAFWSNPANWSTSPVPGTGDTATFSGTSPNTTIDLTGGLTIGNIYFDTSVGSPSPYTIGAGLVGSQSLTLQGNLNVSSSVTANQTLNANVLFASAIATNVYYNDSANTLIIAGTNSAATAGVKVMQVDGVGNTTVSGRIVSGAGSVNLEKLNTGTLTLSGGAVWTGNGVNNFLPGPAVWCPVVLRSGATVISSGVYTNNGEFVLGGVIANGGAGNNASLTMNGGSLGIASWLSVGRGNGIGGVSSDVVLNNGATIYTGNGSLGFFGAAGNFPKGSVTLNNSSWLTVNGNFYIAESSGSDMTMTLNGSSCFTNRSGNGVSAGRSGKGTLLLNSTGTFYTEGDLVIGYSSFGPTNNALVVLNGSTLKVATTTKRWLQVGRSGSSSADFIISNGAVQLDQNTDLRYSTQDTSTGTNTVTLKAGTITFYSDNATTVGGTGVVDLMQVGSPSAYNTFNLDGGTLTTPQVVSVVPIGTRIFNFNGGTLKAATDGVVLMNLGSGNAWANVRNGGAVIDSNGKNVTLAQALQHSSIAGDAATDGGLTKNGSGTVTLTIGNYTYTGPTTVNAGTLALGGTNLTSQSISVSDGAALAVLAPATYWTPTTMTVGSTTGASLNFAPTSTSQASLRPGTLTLNGVNTINITSGNLAVGSYPLITYTTLAGAGSYSLGTVPSGVAANLSTVGGTIYLNVTGVTNTIWTGAINGTWNIATTANWTNAASGNTYVDGSLVQFDDTGLNTTTISNSVATTLKPGNVSVANNTLNYCFKTNVIIAGTASLTKTGTAALTNSTPNTYTGSTLINQGSVVVGVAFGTNAIGAYVSGALGLNSPVVLANDATASLNLNNFSTQIGSLSGGGPNHGNVILGSATLNVGGDNTTPAAAYAGNISGTGGLTKFGSGTLTLAGTNSFSGATAISGGTVTYASGAVQNSAGALTVGTQNGWGIMNINSGATVAFGNAVSTVGYRNGSGTLNINGGTFSVANDFRPGGSDINGTIYNSYGTVNMTGGNAYLSSITLARGNNYQNAISGELNLSGGTITSTNDVIVGFAGTGHGKVTINGGALNVATAAGKFINIPYWDTTTGEIDITNGSLNLNFSAGIRFCRGNTGTLGSPNFINQEGGTVTFYSDFATTVGGTGGLDMQYSGGATVTNSYNLDGGTLTVPQVISTLSTATRMFNFNGGTLKAAGPSTAFFNLGTGNSFANVRNNGAIIDSAGYNITMAQPLVHSTLDGDNPTDGGLTKLGLGTLTMSGALSYTGPTTVLGGSLNLSGSLGLPSGGDLIVSNATFNLDASGGTMSVNNTTTKASSSLVFGMNASANAINASGNLTLATNTAITLNYGTVNNNPTAAAINAAGSLVMGTNITFNISAVGLGVGTLPLITVPGLASTNGFVIGSLPSGVKAVLTNNVTGELDLLITSAGQLLTWHGADAVLNVETNWDINTSSNWFDIANNPAKYLQYSGNTVGDNVIFGNSGVANPDGTNYVTLNVPVVPATVVFNSGSPYSLTGTGSIVGSTSLVLTNGSSSVFLGTSNSFTGGTVIGATSTLVITNDYALGTTTGGILMAGGTLQLNAGVTNARTLTVSANSSFDVPTNITARFNGAMTGVGGLTKTDNGLLILAGTNDVAGNLQVNQGTLASVGTNSLPAIVRVGNAGGLNGTLAIPVGIFSANYNAGQYNSSLIVGPAAGAYGALAISGGTLNVAQQLGLGAGTGGYADLDISSGALNCGSYIVVGFNNDRAVFNQSGGTVNLSSNLMTIAAGGSGSIGVANLSGGTFISSFPASSGIMVGERGNGTMNVSGSASIITTNSNGLLVGPPNAQTGWSGTLNLNGGAVTVNKLTKGLGTGLALVNLNGGTIKAGVNNASLLSGMDLATIYGGGVTLDDGGYVATLAQSLTPANDAGVSSVTLADGGSGYIETPIVTISGGNGSNATATATVSGGVVTAIVITSPGTGYTLSDSLSVSFTGGGANAVAPTVSSVNLAANTSGALTKQGAGTLTLSGANSYSGPTVVNNGELLLTPAHQTGAPVTVADGARFGVTSSSVSNSATIGALTMGTSGATTLDFVYSLSGNPTNAALTAGAVTLNGTCTIHVGGSFGLGAFPVLKYSSLSGAFNPTVSAPRGMGASVSNDSTHSTIYVVVNSLASAVVWTGTNSLPGKANLWDLNTTTNWLIGSVPTTYQETLPPGDAVVFNDSGSGTVLLSNTASPGSVTISNSAVAYTFQGSGQINAVAGLTKVGSGSVTLSLPGTYSISTTISNGAVNLGTNQTFANLTGDGTIGTASGTPTLTVNNSTNTTFAGSIQGGLGLTTTGSGALTLMGTSTFSGNVFGKGSSKLVIDGTGAIDGGTLWSSIGQDTGDNATLTIKGSGSFTNSADFNLGDIGSASGTLNISNNATLTVGSMYIASANVAGSTASGTVNQAGGAVQNTLLVIGGRTSTNALGIYNLSGGTVTGSGSVRIGGVGTGTMNISGTGSASFVSDSYVGYRTGNGTLNMTGGSLSVGGDFRVAGSDANGTQYIATGLVAMANSTINVSSLTIARGNNNQNAVSGAVYVNTGATFTSTNDVVVGFAGTGHGQLALDGGTFNVGTAIKKWLIIPQYDTTTGEIDITNGALNLNANTDIRFSTGNTGTAGTPNTINQEGGAVTFYSDFATTVGGSGVLDLAYSGASTIVNTYNLDGGVLTVPQVVSSSTGPTRIFNFNGGTLKAAVPTGAFFNLSTGNAFAYVRTGGAIIDTASNDVTIAQALLNNGVDEDGGLTKNGNGALLLNGVNTYTNRTIVNRGSLGGTGTIAGAVTVNSGAGLAPATGSSTLTVSGNLTLNAGSTNLFDVNGTTPANNSVALGGSVTYGGVLTIAPTGTFTVGQTFPLFTGAGAASVSNFSSVQSTDPSVSFSFTNGVLTVTSVAPPLSYLMFVGTPVISGTSLSITVTNSGAGTVTLYTTTNLTAPFNTWTPVWTNTFAGTGTFTTNIPNAVTPANPQQFYKLLGN